MPPQGKIALITGANSGIGLAAAAAFAQEDADLCVTYHPDDQGAQEMKRRVEGVGRHRRRECSHRHRGPSRQGHVGQHPADPDRGPTVTEDAVRRLVTNSWRAQRPSDAPRPQTRAEMSR